MTDEQRQERIARLNQADEHWRLYSPLWQVEQWLSLDDRAFEMVVGWVRRRALVNGRG